MNLRQIINGVDWHEARVTLEWHYENPEKLCDCHTPGRVVEANLSIEGPDPRVSAWDLLVYLCRETAEQIAEDLK